MIVLRSDVLSPLLNLVWLGCALLAASCVCRHTSRPALGVLAVAPVLAAPVMVGTQAGQAYNDIAALGFLLAALAAGLEADGWGGMAIAGFAVGLAVGTRLTMIIPATVALVVVLVSRWYVVGRVTAGLSAPGVQRASGRA